MSIEFGISEAFPVSPEVVYGTWLDSEGHAAMIGTTASASKIVGAEFMVHDGYITGKNLELIPGSLIRQTWRTQEFDASDPDSDLKITLSPEGSGTRLTLKHTNLPGHRMRYKDGWVEHYFAPMKANFDK
jgi:activator of HSP90 ATPase